MHLLKRKFKFTAPAALCSAPPHRFTDGVERALDRIEELALHHLPEDRRRWYAVKLFERDEKVRAQLALDREIIDCIETGIAACEREQDDDAESIITAGRYDWITSVISTCFQRKCAGQLTVSDKIDKIVTNRVLALPIFVAVMALVYAVAMGGWTISIGTAATDWANDVLFGEWVPSLFDAVLTGVGVAEESWLYGLIQNGIVAGVGHRDRTALPHSMPDC